VRRRKVEGVVVGTKEMLQSILPFLALLVRVQICSYKHVEESHEGSAEGYQCTLYFLVRLDASSNIIFCRMSDIEPLRNIA
jgi:hypothetical protein